MSAQPKEHTCNEHFLSQKPVEARTSNGFGQLQLNSSYKSSLLLGFFFCFTSYPPLSNIPNDTFLHRDLAMGYTDPKTCTSSFLSAAVWNVGRWSYSRGAVSHQATLTYCSAAVRSTSFACPTHRRSGIRADTACGFFFFPSMQHKKPQCRLCLVPGTATEHKRQENEEIAFMSYFLGLCCSCHSKAKEMGLFTQRRQV